MTTPDPAAIARRLSPAQRRAFLALEQDDRWQKAPKGARWAMWFSSLMDTDERWWKLNALGLQVRAALLEQEGGEHG